MSKQATVTAPAYAEDSHVEFKPLHHSTYRKWAEACGVPVSVVREYHLTTGIRPFESAVSAQVVDFPGMGHLQKMHELDSEVFRQELRAGELTVAVAHAEAVLRRLRLDLDIANRQAGMSRKLGQLQARMYHGAVFGSSPV